METVYVDKGIVRLYNGTPLYIEVVQYSDTGLGNWEDTYYPNEHISTLDGVTTLGAHKYRRVRHAGDQEFQLPMKWIPDDGQSVMLRTTETAIEWKLELSSTWNTLVSLEDIKGEQGDQGVAGTGLNVQASGTLSTRPSLVSNTSSCTPCNSSGTSNVTVPYLFMSIGNHKITADDIGDETTYWHTLDGSTWTQTTNDHLGLIVLGWKATAGTGTDVLTTNLLGQTMLYSATGLSWADAESKGNIYAFAENTWTKLTDITTPTGTVKSNDSDTLEYLEEKVDNVTIEITGNTLNVKDASITKAKLATGIFTDGLDESGGVVKAKVEDFAGFGLLSYISTLDSEEDLQVNVNDFISDGLLAESSASADGETANLIKVNVDDFISPTTGVYTGLQTSTDAGITETDGYDNIYVKAGAGIEVDVDGINVAVDDVTIEVGTVSETLNIKDNGVSKLKVNVDVFNTTKGFTVTNLDASGVELNIDTDDFVFTGGALTLKDDGVTGDKLNSGIVDTTKGIDFVNDKIIAKIDTGSLEFDIISGNISVKDSYVTGLIPTTDTANLLAGDAKLNISGGTGAILGTSDVTITLVEGELTHVTSTADSVHTQYVPKSLIDAPGDLLVGSADNTLVRLAKGTTGYVLKATAAGLEWAVDSSASLTPATSVTQLDGLSSEGTSTDYARADHKHSIQDAALTIAKTNGLSAALSAKVEKDSVYGSSKIDSTNGLLLRSSGGSWFKLTVDGNGNLGTTLIA